MNFFQLHEQVRIEITRRMNRGQLTGTLLARQTGLRASHISNFVRAKRKLSIFALDRVLAAQLLSIEDLLPESDRISLGSLSHHDSVVPLVSAATALHAPIVTPRATLESIHLPETSLEQLRPRRTLAKRDWQRFVAVRLTAIQARPMEPLLTPGAILVIDRHYNSLVPVSAVRPNIYAVDIVNTLAFRYVTYQANRLILRPHAADFPVELLRLGVEESPSALLVGRICFAISPI
jgi:hypothetical protein